MGSPHWIAFPVMGLLFPLCLMMSWGVIPSNGYGCYNGFRESPSRWKTMRIRISYKFGSQERNQIERVIEKLRDILPCVQFQILPFNPRPSRLSGDYIHFTNRDPRCVSRVGKIGGEQYLYLGSGLVSDTLIMHELLHALGLHHEHQRSDRDDYVDIFWKNIQPKFTRGFRKLFEKDFTDFGVPYNYQSIMHYHSDALSKNGKPTILKKDGSEIEWNAEIQDSDILKLRRFYNCSNEEVP